MGWWSSIIQYFASVIPHLSWWDLADILIVAALVYRLLLLIKGTRSVQVLRALGLLFFVFWFADQFRIRTVRAILGNIFDNIFVIVILLFQNDIRRAFQQMGKATLFNVSNSIRDSQLIEELVKSCVSLSNRKIGALLVLERQADVLDFIEPGTIVDSLVSKELLNSIFLPVSPLHDGAVVVRKGRVFMAGCFLPLTLNPNTSKAIGTRHRAAIGLTEETDAVCIVVSEENGAISVASGGRIMHNLDAAQVRKNLLEIV